MKKGPGHKISLGSSVKKPDAWIHHMCDHMSIIKLDEHMHTDIVRLSDRKQFSYNQPWQPKFSCNCSKPILGL